MKKTLLTLFTACCALCSAAQTAYTEPLVVTINGESSAPMTANFTIEEKGTDKLCFELKNFCLVTPEQTIGVGNIRLDDVDVVAGRVNTFSTQQTINIEDGDDDSQMWLAAMLPPVPINMHGGYVKDGKVYVSIDIDLQAVLGQTIGVTLGTNGLAAVDASYTDDLVVTINGESSEPMPASIDYGVSMTGEPAFALHNFRLVSGEEAINVGNILLDGLTVTTPREGLYEATTSQSLFITAGDDDSQMWIGPMLGAVPVDFTAHYTTALDENHIFCTIDIDMQQSLGQTIAVKVGVDRLAIKENAYSELIENQMGQSLVYLDTGYSLRNEPCYEFTIPGLGTFFISGIDKTTENGFTEGFAYLEDVDLMGMGMPMDVKVGVQEYPDNGLFRAIIDMGMMGNFLVEPTPIAESEVCAFTYDGTPLSPVAGQVCEVAGMAGDAFVVTPLRGKVMANDYDEATATQTVTVRPDDYDCYLYKVRSTQDAPLQRDAQMAAREKTYTFHFQTAGIDTLTLSPAAALYDLQGQRVSSPTHRGVYIQGGRKVVK